jgi:hypothetical protein
MELVINLDDQLCRAHNQPHHPQLQDVCGAANGSPIASVFQTRLKQLRAARRTVPACSAVRMHGRLRDVDRPPAMRAVRVEFMNEVGK